MNFLLCLLGGACFVRRTDIIPEPFEMRKCFCATVMLLSRMFKLYSCIMNNIPTEEKAAPNEILSSGAGCYAIEKLLLIVCIKCGIVTVKQRMDTLDRVKQVADGLVVVEGIDNVGNILAHIDLGIPLF